MLQHGIPEDACALVAFIFMTDMLEHIMPDPVRASTPKLYNRLSVMITLFCAGSLLREAACLPVAARRNCAVYKCDCGAGGCGAVAH